MSATNAPNLVSQCALAREGITSRLKACESLLSLAKHFGSPSDRSGMVATLTGLNSALAALAEYLEELERQLQKEPKRIKLELRGRVCSLSLGAAHHLVHSIMKFNHDLGHAIQTLEMVLRPRSGGREDAIGRDLEQACATLEWHTAIARELFDWAADVPVEMNQLIAGAIRRSGLSPNVAVLPVDKTNGWVRGSLEIALGAFLRALDRLISRPETLIARLGVAAALTDDLQERTLELTVTAPVGPSSLHLPVLLSDAIGGTFERHSQGPLFDLYAAARMLSECGASIVTTDRRAEFVVLIHIPFAEKIQSAG